MPAASFAHAKGTVRAGLSSNSQSSKNKLKKNPDEILTIKPSGAALR